MGWALGVVPPSGGTDLSTDPAAPRLGRGPGSPVVGRRPVALRGGGGGSFWRAARQHDTGEGHTSVEVRRDPSPVLALTHRVVTRGVLDEDSGSRSVRGHAPHGPHAPIA